MADERYKQTTDEAAEIQHRLLDRHASERQRLAQKLHQGPLQELQSLNFTISALAQTPEINQEVLSALVQIRASVQQVAQQLRALQQELYPPTLAAFGLAAAIRSYTKPLQNSYPTLPIHLQLDEDGGRLPQPVRTSLFDICEQALMNVVQHAQAQQVQVKLTLNVDQVSLEVSDDGCGFEVPSQWITIIREGCLGLASIIERTEALQGRWQIVSAPGKGTTLYVSAPLALPTA